VSCNSGTAALHLALLALGVGPGDEVIVPDFTMAACAFAVSYTGATPVFADVSLETYAILPSEIERLITKRTKAIMAVHVYGRLAPMNEIVRIARARRIPVIEDASEAQGAVYRSKADITAYSFYRNKIIPAEEGGIVCTDTKRYADRMQYLKNMAFDKAHSYFHADVGYNYRMPNLEAALALKNLARYPQLEKKRRAIEAAYAKAFPMPRRDAVWFYELSVPPSVRAKILAAVPSARRAFRPLSTLPMYGGRKGEPNARALSDSLVMLPAHPSLSGREVQDVIAAVRAVLHPGNTGKSPRRRSRA
jgi:dTDP-4-amino-4,6-dideoxygalactose transaminase